HFGGAGLLGGEFELNEGRSQLALTGLATEMSKAARRKVTIVEAAQGVLAVANTNMERALRRISVERGFDSREFALLPFGGAGGLHAVDLARALRMPEIILPVSAGALSAIGVLTADVVKDQSRTVMIEVGPDTSRKLERTFGEMQKDATAALRSEGFGPRQQQHERSLGMRYQGQSFELMIKETRGDLAAAFHQAHLARYGYAQESNTVEVVSARVRSTGVVEKPAPKRFGIAGRKSLGKPGRHVSAYIDGKKMRVAVYDRDELPAGARLSSPCIVTEYSSTTLVPPGAKAALDDFGNLIIQVT
ncbi:MAG TPA: hydantoinase/oxoprolinase family protein, partial [Pyrinomonadaceae bacterium]|nr:hydantoinase/oxoprolinase family protein [Pyrinomonadaceae bacterium]